MIRKYVKSFAAVLGLAILTASFALIPNRMERRIYAQTQASFPTGFYAIATNQFTNTAIGSALAVTNPASNFLMNVQGGPIYCNSSEQMVGQSTLQLAASNTYLIVWNCGTEQLYAKTAVVAPGGSVATTSGGIPGQPGTFLAAAPPEIPIALVVCGSTNCGNTSNGTITDQRPVGLFPGAGTPLNTSLQANLPAAPNGTIIFCTDCTTASACLGSGTGAFASRQNGAWKCLFKEEDWLDSVE